MLRFFAEIDRRDRLLSRLGWFHVALLALFVMAMMFDHRTLFGVNVWVKPSKFAASIAIYVWTVAWLMPYLTGPQWAKGLIRWGTTVAMIVEIVCIAGQAARGVPSHFNDRTLLDGTIFTVMGLFILFNLLLDILLLVLFFRHHAPLPESYLWGIRAGLIGIILGGAVGIAMVANRAHTVGGPDGGPGLPVLNWSTERGDLRVSHALALHALQILPIFGYVLSRVRLSPRGKATGIAAFSLLYALLVAATFLQAVAGHPLVGRLS